jgi:Flp pilus assembly pilin Flp
MYKWTRHGQAISEWALAITLIAAVSLVAFSWVSGGVGTIFSDISSSIRQPVSSGNPGPNPRPTPTTTPSPTPSPTPTPTPGPGIVIINPNPVTPGGPTTGSCAGFAGDSPVSITMDSGDVLKIVVGTATADSGGVVTDAPLTIPIDTQSNDYTFGCDGSGSDGTIIGDTSGPVSVNDSGVYASVNPYEGLASKYVQVCATGFPAGGIDISFYGVQLSGDDGSMSVDSSGHGCKYVNVPGDAVPGDHNFELTSVADSSRYADAAFTVDPASCIPNLVSDTFSRANTGYWDGDGTYAFGNEEGPCHLAWTGGIALTGSMGPPEAYIDNGTAVSAGGGDNWSTYNTLSPNMTLPMHGQYLESEGQDPDNSGRSLILVFNGGQVIAEMIWATQGRWYDLSDSIHSFLELSVDGGNTWTVEDPQGADICHCHRPIGVQADYFPINFSTDDANNINFTVDGYGFSAHVPSPTLTVLDSMTIQGNGDGGGRYSFDDLRITGAANAIDSAYLANSTVSVADSTLAAGDSTAVTVTIRNFAGPFAGDIAGQTVALNAGGGTVSALTNHHDGTYTGTFTATHAGPATVGAQIGNDAIDATAAVTVTTGAADPAHSYWVTDDWGTWTGVDPLTVMPDGTAYAVITLKVFDAGGNPVLSGAPVSFHTTVGDIGDVTAVGDGTYTAHLTSTVAGTATITALIGGVAISGTPSVASQVVFPGDLLNTTITAAVNGSPSSTVTFGDSATITVQLRDMTDSVVGSSQGVVTLTVVPAVTCTLSSYDQCPNYYAFGSATSGHPGLVTATDNNNGTYTATFNTTPTYTPYWGGTAPLGNGGTGDFTIEGYLDGNPLHHGVIIHETAGTYSLVNSSWKAAVGQAPADGTTVPVTMTVLDAGRNLLTDSTGVNSVTFDTTAGSFAGCTTGCLATDNHDGTWTAQLSSTTSGTARITGYINGTVVTGYSPEPSVDFAPILSNSYWTSSQTDGTVVADGTSTYDLILTGIGTDNSSISNNFVYFTTTDPGASLSSYYAYNNNNNTGPGTYTISVTSTNAGPVTIDAESNYPEDYFPSFTVHFVTSAPTPTPTPAGTTYAGNDPFFTVTGDDVGWYSGYATSCRLVGAGGSQVTFSSPGTWTMDSYGQTHSAVSVDGTSEGYIDGGGSVTYTNGPFPTGDVTITAQDGGSTQSDGQGGSSLCFSQIVINP